MNMKSAVVGGALAVLVGGSAWAGTKHVYSVTVDTTSRSAYGAMGTARASADTAQFIGCSVQGFQDGTEQVICGARSAQSIQFYCTSKLASHVAAARAISDSSYIYFNWDEGTRCTYLYVSNESSWAPKQP